jgi:mRNA guanylyltransferase
MERAYAIEKVLLEDLPKLKHGNDGLIFTCAESGYVVGTDERMHALLYILHGHILTRC